MAVSLDGNRKMYRFNRNGTTDVPWRSVCIPSFYLQKELGKTQKIEFVCTDVMCKYYPYLKRVCEAFPDLEYLLQMQPFLSVMHAKGHSTKCEVEWGGRNQEGAGLTVGEEVEAVNLFMFRAALTTKYMTKSARTDMITIHVRGWNLRKKLNLHNYLAQRYVKTLQRTAEVAGEIEMTKSHLNKTSEDLQQWVTDVQLWAASNSNKDRRRKRSAIAKEKSKLEEAITSYNALVSNAEAVDPADTLLAQDFSIWPWETAEPCGQNM
ncbi:uncharacterized protein LOC132099398 [Carassius carassius]|uniref:uncharacterized protein LOC132099398 n=1 Tax=Carassius carassius TaxID=217509 RepID=UPI002869701F|nr:uncharacterized protein LOC132099398 [Carassius carassius]